MPQYWATLNLRKMGLNTGGALNDKGEAYSMEQDKWR